MRRIITCLAGALAVAAVAAPAANAGSPYFINSAFSAPSAGNTLTVSGKEAGLGDEAQIHVEFSATALRINPGRNHPKAADETRVSAAGDFPVQNGKANFTLSATATFQPECSPPMTVEFTDSTSRTPPTG